MQTAGPLYLERAKRCLTQAELAKRAGVNVTTLRDLESGKRTPRAETLGRVAVALGLDVEDLISQ